MDPSSILNLAAYIEVWSIFPLSIPNDNNITDIILKLKFANVRKHLSPQNPRSDLTRDKIELVKTSHLAKINANRIIFEIQSWRI